MWNVANLISCISSLKTQRRLLVQFPHNGTEFEKFCTHFLHLLQCDQSGQRWSKCHLLILLWLNDTACTWCSGITKYMTQEDPKDPKRLWTGGSWSLQTTGNKRTTANKHLERFTIPRFYLQKELVGQSAAKQSTSLDISWILLMCLPNGVREFTRLYCSSWIVLQVLGSKAGCIEDFVEVQAREGTWWARWAGAGTGWCFYWRCQWIWHQRALAIKTKPAQH